MYTNETHETSLCHLLREAMSWPVVKVNSKYQLFILFSGLINPNGFYNNITHKR